MEKRLLLLASSAMMLMAAPAWAQTAPAAAEGQQASDDVGLGEIIVTAQRRSENLSKVPIAITAADAGALATARVENVSSIQNLTPSATFRSSNISSSTANVIVRGLGTTGNARAFEGSVGVFIDGVYRTRAGAALQTFLDIDGLQLLRGPQGTLFGKNTTSGALLLNSTTPTLGERSANIDISVGNYSAVVARAGVTLPLGDKAAIRVAGVTSRMDGLVVNPNGGRYNNGETQGGKVQLLLKPTDDLTIRILGDYTQTNANCCYAAVNYVNGASRALVNSLIVARGLVAPSNNLTLRQQVLSDNGTSLTKDYGGSLNIDINALGGTIKSITALRRFSVDNRGVDVDYSGAAIVTSNEAFTSKFFSQELTYNTKIEALNADFVLGGFYSNETVTMPRALTWGSQAQAYFDALAGAGRTNAAVGQVDFENMGGKNKSYAGFAHLESHLTDTLSFTAGIRYSTEEKRGYLTYDYFRPVANDPLRVLGSAPGPNYDTTVKQSAVSGTFGIQYSPSRDVMLYATYNRGFKAGGVNIDVNAAGIRRNNPNEVSGGVPLSPVYRPEKVNAYEVGIKAQYLDRRARTNISAFYYDLSDIQIAQFIGAQFTIINATTAKNYGFEIENTFKLNQAITLSADATWIPSARYGTEAKLGVLSNSRFRYAPEFQTNLAVNLDQPVTSTVNLTGRLQYQYFSKQFVNTASTLEQPAVSLVNANLGVRLPDHNLSFELWALNLTDRTYISNAFNVPLQTGSQNVYLAPPRTFGARLRASF